jgi:hypothetical protein
MGADMPKNFTWMRDLEIADLHWQLLKRNEHYRAAYKRFSEKHPGFPARIPYMQLDRIKRASRDAQIFENKWGCAPADPYVHTSPFLEVIVDPEAMAPVYSQETKILRFDIPINMPSEAILRWVRYWVGHYKRNESSGQEITKKRLQDIKLAIKAYDLKMAGKRYIDIDKELKLDPGYRGTGLDRAKNLFNTAKTWIKRAEMKSLWISAPWVFDSIIFQHRRSQELKSSDGG